MNVEKGSPLEAILTRHQIERLTAVRSNFGGDTTLVTTAGDIKVTTYPNGNATIQLSKKATPIKVSI